MDSSLTSSFDDFQIKESNDHKNNLDDAKVVNHCTIKLLFPDWLCLFWNGWLDFQQKPLHFSTKF